MESGYGSRRRLAPSSIRFQDQHQPIRVLAKYESVGVAAERRCIDDDKIEVFTQLKNAIWKTVRRQKVRRIGGDSARRKGPQVGSSYGLYEGGYWSLLQEGVRSSPGSTWSRRLKERSMSESWR